MSPTLHLTLKVVLLVFVSIKTIWLGGLQTASLPEGLCLKLPNRFQIFARLSTRSPTSASMLKVMLPVLLDTGTSAGQISESVTFRSTPSEAPEQFSYDPRRLNNEFHSIFSAESHADDARRHWFTWAAKFSESITLGILYLKP